MVSSIMAEDYHYSALHSVWCRLLWSIRLFSRVRHLKPLGKERGTLCLQYSDLTPSRKREMEESPLKVKETITARKRQLLHLTIQILCFASLKDLWKIVLYGSSAFSLPTHSFILEKCLEKNDSEII